jgi:hypothetical protein
MPEEARRKGFVAEIRVFSSRGAGWLIAKYAVGCHEVWSAICHFLYDGAVLCTALFCIKFIIKRRKT